MKLQIMSDLHLEFPLNDRYFHFRKAPGVDALILAGDIHAHLGIFTLQERLQEFDDVPIYYVPGNHEYYHTDFLKARDERALLADRLRIRWPNLYVMDDSAHRYKGNLILGGTLWTDVDRGNWYAEKYLKSCMGDFAGLIGFGKDENNAPKAFSPSDSADQHLSTLEYFNVMLTEYPDYPAVIISHHLPDPICSHPKYKHSPLNPGFFSDLSDFMARHNNINLWVHGHTHDSVDVSVNKVRIVCNPLGYPSERNPNFDPYFTVDI